ncbi:MAG: hypothetical protein MSIBF_04270 [Candidatus Altiarchaeales archaeon IMC4]|nr:MAG: hypothetical protein MSIBF_04270 [Candidatus Altiarchaeales archaeon IMC4]
MAGSELDLLVFGDTAIDHFYEVDTFPKINEAAEAKNPQKFYGGMGANTAVAASVLGLKTGLVSVIGSDAEDYRRYLQNLGIKVHLTAMFGDTTHSIFFKNNGRQISFFYKGLTDKLDEQVPDKDIIASAKAVYMSRTYLNLQKQVAKFCTNKFLVYNPGYGVFKFSKVPEEIYTILKKTNVLILNNHEMEHLRKIGFGISNKLGPKVFIITNGKNGCSVYLRSTQINVPAFKTEALDTSGAGDAFNAGFIAACLRGYETTEAAKIGNATASFVVEKWGCQMNLPNWEQVMGRVEKM